MSNKTNIIKSEIKRNVPSEKTIRAGDLLHKTTNHRVYIVADLMGEHVIMDLVSGQQYPFDLLSDLSFVTPNMTIELTPQSDPQTRGNY